MPCDTQALHASCFSLNRLRLYGYISICAITHTTPTSVPRTPMPWPCTTELSLTGGLTPLTPNPKAKVGIGAPVRVKRRNNGAGLRGRVELKDKGRIGFSRKVNGNKTLFFTRDTSLEVVPGNAKEPKKLKLVYLDTNTPMYPPPGGWNNPYRRGAEVMVIRDYDFEGTNITGEVIQSYDKRVIIYDREHGVRYSAPYYWFSYLTTESRFFCEVSTALDAWNDAKMQHTTAASVSRVLRAGTRTHRHNLRPRRDAAGGLTR